MRLQPDLGGVALPANGREICGLCQYRLHPAAAADHSLAACVTARLIRRKGTGDPSEVRRGLWGAPPQGGLSRL